MVEEEGCCDEEGDTGEEGVVAGGDEARLPEANNLSGWYVAMIQTKRQGGEDRE